MLLLVKLITGVLAGKVSLNPSAMVHIKAVSSPLLNISLTNQRPFISVAAKLPKTSHSVTAAIKAECIKEIYFIITLKPTESSDNSGLSESKDSHSAITNNSLVNA